MQSDESYKLENLQNLFFSLCNQKSNPSPQTFPDTLNEIGKIIVWGQQNNSDIFQFVCEVKLFEMLLQVFSKSKEKDIINGIIGFYNMLLTNFNKQQTINYLLSHPCIISMQLTKFGNMGNQIAEYYINFLKGISRKITINTVHIFFNKRFPNFPLLWQTCRFFNHPQNLVRTTSRNIILSLSRFAQTTNLQNKRLYEYFTGFPFVIYYIHQCNFMKQYWKIIDSILDELQDKDYELQQLDTLIQDHEELLFFLDDLLATTKKVTKQEEQLLHKQQQQIQIQDVFISSFINECLSKLVLSLCSVTKSHFGIKTSLLVFILLLNTIRNKFFVQTIVLALFGKYYSRKLSFKVLHPIQTLISYNKQWKFKGFWDAHQQKIQQYCSKTYYIQKAIVSDLSSKNSLLNTSQVTKQNQTQLQLKKKPSTTSSIGINEAMSVFGINPNYYDRQVQKIQQMFALNILKRQNKETFQLPASKLIKNQLKKLQNFQQADLMNDYQQNPVSEAILSFLNTKDDTLIMLTLCLLDQIIKSKLLDHSLLNFCRLNIHPKNKDFSSIINMEKIVFSCVKIFEVDPPSYRICTYKAASSILLHFVKFYTQNQNFSIPEQLQKKLKKTVLMAIQRIYPYLYGGKQWQKAIEFYNLINKQNNKFRKNTIKTYGLIPQEHFTNKQTYNYCQTLYQQFPQSFDQQIGRDFWVYLIVKQLYQTLFDKKNQNLQKYDIIPNNESKNQLKYEQGKAYDLQKDQFFSAQFKLLNSQKYNECQIILLGAYIVIGFQKKVQYKCRYQQTILLPDKSDPRKLILKQNKLSLSILFQNLKQALLMKQNFKQNKSLLLKCELSSLIKQIQAIQKKVK